MPRAARVVLPNVPLHIVQRGNNRAPCFFGDVDYGTYLAHLRFCARRFGCSVHAYCLMTNHVHLLVTPQDAQACGEFMKALGQGYVQYVNKARGRTGTLWEGRFKSCLVGSEDYVLACYRYIELNPVRAGLVQHPGEYPWSSYHANTRRQGGSTIDFHPAYAALAEDADGRVHAYEALFGSLIEANVIEEIRRTR